jgi:ATP-dependent Clp protease protease subunit
MRSWFKVLARAADQPAEISIYDEIGMWGVSAKEFIGALRGIDAKTIVVSINSPGGSVFDALAIYNALRQHDAEITTRVMGIAASAASLIAMAGDTIEMPENTFMMLHNPLTFAYGNADELRDMAEVLDKIGSSLTATYVKRSGQPEADVQALLDAETWLTATEAVAKGFATTMLPSLAVEAAFEIERLPENIRAVFEARKTPPVETPVAPTATRATQIVAAATAAGFDRFAATWAMDTKVQPGASLDAVIAEAREIGDLCAAAGYEAEADALITARKPLADVFAHLTDLRAAADESRHTDGAPKPNKLEATVSVPNAVTTGGIWANRKKQLSQRSI